MKDPVFSEAQEQRIKELMLQTLNEFFKSQGKSVQNLLFAAAAIIGALMVILGGLKTFLGWLGFSYIVK